MSLPAGDQYWYSKVLGLHCDGANNSTTFTDVKGKTVTANGNAKISTAQYPSLTGKTSSGSLDGSGDYLSVPDSSDWDFGTGDFTVRVYVRFSSFTNSPVVVSNYLNSTTGWTIQYTNADTSLKFYNGDTALVGTTWSGTTNVWYLVEVSRSGTSLKMFLSGVQLGTTATNSTNITGSSEPLRIGRIGTGSSVGLNGYISEVEIYKGVALNTAAYTPSSDPFVDNYVRVSGTTKDSGGNFASRLVRVYRQDTGAFVGEQLSNGTTGEWAITAANTGSTITKHFAVMHDDDANPPTTSENALIYDNITPY